MNKELLKYLIESITKEKTGCWVWNKKPTNKGYGRAWFDNHYSIAHRLVYEFFEDKIPAEKQIDHLCRNRLCVNPDHLEIVSPQENVLRGIGLAAKNARKIQCKMGHKFTNESTYITKKGGRQCKICSNVYHKRYYLSVTRRKP